MFAPEARVCGRPEKFETFAREREREMWRAPLVIESDQQGPAATMAHRRWACTGKVLLGAAAVALFAALVMGSVLMEHRVTVSRGRIFGLERQKRILEVETALLMVRWNRETSLAAITAAAEKRLHLCVSSQPDSVLITVPDPSRESSPWRRWREQLGGRDLISTATAAPLALRAWPADDSEARP